MSGTHLVSVSPSTHSSCVQHFVAAGLEIRLVAREGNRQRRKEKFLLDIPPAESGRTASSLGSLFARITDRNRLDAI